MGPSNLPGQTPCDLLLVEVKKGYLFFEENEQPTKKKDFFVCLPDHNQYFTIRILLIASVYVVCFPLYMHEHSGGNVGNEDIIEFVSNMIKINHDFVPTSE